MNRNTYSTWDAYIAEEIERVTPVIKDAGFALDTEQPHVKGERYVMRAVTTASGKKALLLGTHTATGERVVIKASSDPGGRKEIEHERDAKALIEKLKFAYEVFSTPRELWYRSTATHTIAVYEYIANDTPFLELPTKTQAGIALRAFKAQESAHATTYHHKRLIEGVFETRDAATYLAQWNSFKDSLIAHAPRSSTLLNDVGQVLDQNREIIDRYGKFLTHVDFVPHNFRLRGDCIYLLDYSSLRFGNKYEGWARFLNFMALYNPPLERALTEYVSNNRFPGEKDSLHVMRLYRLTELATYYLNTLDHAEGTLRTLNTARVQFWLDMLEVTLENKPMSEARRIEYQQLRDSLRSDDEKKRQQIIY